MDELTFREFAFAKAVTLKYAAVAAIVDILADEGYVNTDHDGYALSVLTRSDERPVLDVTMFDFERYHDTEDAERKWPGIAEHQQKMKMAVYNIDTITHYRHHTPESTYGNRAIQTAAMIVLLQQAGIPEDDRMAA